MSSLEGEPPVAIWLFDKAYQWRGLVPAPENVEALIAWNSHDSVVFTVTPDNPRLPALLDPGARAVVTLNRPAFDAPKVLVSGPVTEVQGTGIAEQPLRVFTVSGDFAIFDEIVGWPVPSASITAQTSAPYHVVSGPAETVVRTLVSENAPRQGVAISVGASLGLGPSMTVQVRMHTLADRLFPKVTALGLGVTVVQQPNEQVRRLLTWIPATHTRALTDESGVILPGAEFSVHAPSATRVIVGAGGEGTARLFRQYIDASAEARWGVSRAVFVDARDVATTDANLDQLLQARADEAFAENAETVNLKIELTETDNWQFMVTFNLGDMIPVRLAGGVDVTDRVQEVQISWTSDSGLEITPRIGSWEESPDDRMYKLVAKALKVGRNLEVTR